MVQAMTTPSLVERVRTELEPLLKEIEGYLLYCPPRLCARCIDGHPCAGIPTCLDRQTNHDQSLRLVRAAPQALAEKVAGWVEGLEGAAQHMRTALRPAYDYTFEVLGERTREQMRAAMKEYDALAALPWRNRVTK